MNETEFFTESQWVSFSNGEKDIFLAGMSFATGLCFDPLWKNLSYSEEVLEDLKYYFRIVSFLAKKGWTQRQIGLAFLGLFEKYPPKGKSLK